MTDFICLLIFGAAWTWGIYCIFSGGYLLQKIGDKIKTAPKWVYKPLIACPACMASVHGFIISAYYCDFRIWSMVAYMVCLCGLNFILKEIIYPEYE